MKATNLLLILQTLLGFFLLNTVQSSDINCSELKSIPLIGSFFVSNSKQKQNLEVDFLLSTNEHREPEEVGPRDWTFLENFNVSRKTIVLIHGYKSSGRKNWILKLKDALLDFRPANVILVDWSKGSYQRNYVSSAKNTEIVTNRLIEFFQSMRPQIEMSNLTSDTILWNHLHFIGHSLGAQISGQIAHYLREDKFWKVERITGLDPANPCFKDLQPLFKLDKEDADFVDVIHTQSGNGGKNDALGLKENIGHMDFYVNGGVVQPECTGSAFTPRWNTMICSHRLSYKYFIESVTNAIHNNCTLLGYSWDGTLNSALDILNSKLIDVPCDNCPEMGINAINSNKRGKFLVISAAHEPYCDFTYHDIQGVKNVIRRIKE